MLAHVIDNPTVRSHSQAAGAKGGLSVGFWSITRRLYDENPRPGRRSGTPSRLYPEACEASDYNAVPDLLAMPVGKPRLFLADKSYDGDFLREELRIHGIRQVIPPKTNRKSPPAYDFRANKDRSRVERMFNRLQHSDASPPTTTKPENPSQHSSPCLPSIYDCHTLSAGPSVGEWAAIKLDWTDPVVRTCQCLFCTQAKHLRVVDYSADLPRQQTLLAKIP